MSDALREMYQTLEFSSLLRELASGREARRQRDYQQLGSKAELDAWFAALPADAPVAVAVGEMMEQPVFGIFGEARRGAVAALWTKSRPARPSRTISKR